MLDFETREATSTKTAPSQDVDFPPLVDRRVDAADAVWLIATGGVCIGLIAVMKYERWFSFWDQTTTAYLSSLVLVGFPLRIVQNLSLDGRRGRHRVETIKALIGFLVTLAILFSLTPVGCGHDR